METPRLGDLEIEVLELVWARRQVDVKTTFEAIGGPRGISSNTVQSALERLFRKRLLARERIGHAFFYSALISKNDFRARAAVAAAGELHGAQAHGVLSAFVALAANEDRANLDLLAAIVAEARAARRAK